MPKYLVKAKYTVPAGVTGLREDGGTARVKAVSDLCESLGGKLESFYFAFGDVDVYTVVDLPDNTAAAAASVIVAASGDVNVEFVPLLTAEEMDIAIKKSPVYDAPGRE